MTRKTVHIVYINFVCHLQKCQYIYQKMRHLFINELYFGFSQTFKDAIK